MEQPNLEWQADGVVTAFSSRWIQGGSEPPSPADGAWFVSGADGSTAHLVEFESFENASADSAGTVRMLVKTFE